MNVFRRGLETAWDAGGMHAAKGLRAETPMESIASGKFGDRGNPT